MHMSQTEDPAAMLPALVWTVVIVAGDDVDSPPQDYSACIWRGGYPSLHAATAALQRWCAAYQHSMQRIGRPIPPLQADTATVEDICAWFATTGSGAGIEVIPVHPWIALLLDECAPLGALWESALPNLDDLNRAEVDEAALQAELQDLADRWCVADMAPAPVPA